MGMYVGESRSYMSYMVLPNRVGVTAGELDDSHKGGVCACEKGAHRAFICSCGATSA